MKTGKLRAWLTSLRAIIVAESHLNLASGELGLNIKYLRQGFENNILRVRHGKIAFAIGDIIEAEAGTRAALLHVRLMQVVLFRVLLGTIYRLITLLNK